MPTKKIRRFSRPRSSNAPRPNQNAAHRPPTMAAAATMCFALASRSRRRTANVPISAMPIGSAISRHRLEISSAGVVMSPSLAACCHAGHNTIARNARQALVATASMSALPPGLRRATMAVMRMCSPRRSATTEPNMASHRNRMDASSSDQTSGLCSTKRATTPASSTTMSATTSTAAGTSTSQPRAASMRASQPRAAVVCVAIGPLAASGNARPSGSRDVPGDNSPSRTGFITTACRRCVPAPPSLRRRTSPSSRCRSRPCAGGRGTGWRWSR